ncbi:MAG: synapsin-1 (Synapsin I) [Clostridiales bacterium]|nr:synapsin-1 (Synapsin I) [Clostridiales bacterium]
MPSNIPPEAALEIMEVIGNRMQITSDELADILKRHGVNGDEEALQTGYRKRVGQRFIASILDEEGNRELFAQGKDYVLVQCCNDLRQLTAIQSRLRGSMEGLNSSAEKIQRRISLLRRFVRKEA